MFIVMLLMCIMPLIVLRVLNIMVEENKVSVPHLRGNCLKVWLRKFWIMATVDRIFWPIIIYPLYLMLGPWSMGYLVEDHLGVIFAWGIFVNGSFLPGSFTYVYGFVQVSIV